VLIRDALLERSQLALLTADLAAERNRAREAESASARLAGELAVRRPQAPFARGAAIWFGSGATDTACASPLCKASEATREALQTELADIKRRLWETEEQEQRRCVHFASRTVRTCWLTLALLRFSMQAGARCRAGGGSERR
jgi:hypothetical protein